LGLPHIAPAKKQGITLMTIPLARTIEGEKFMWDGTTYENEDEAQKTVELYEKDGFSVQMLNEDDKYLVYSRRIATIQTDAG
jgi:hypothetical protein